MKLPRYIDGRELADLLSRYGYSIIRQTGSHLRLMSDLREEVHNLTIPRSQATQDRHLECRALGRRQIPGDGQAGACRPALRAIDSSCRWGDGREPRGNVDCTQWGIPGPHGESFSSQRCVAARTAALTERVLELLVNWRVRKLTVLCRGAPEG
jgi:predicted RNA binding protein YcfA (HicA-like mRNA interferase family)